TVRGRRRQRSLGLEPAVEIRPKRCSVVHGRDMLPDHLLHATFTGCAGAQLVVTDGEGLQLVACDQADAVAVPGWQASVAVVLLHDALTAGGRHLDPGLERVRAGQAQRRTVRYLDVPVDQPDG